MIKFNNNRGLTLIELIVTLGILGIIITPLSALFINSAKYSRFAEDKLKATSIAQEYMEKIKSQDIVNEGEKRETRGNFEVIINIDDDSRYRFLNLVEDEPIRESKDNIKYNFTVKVGNEDSIVIFDENNSLLFNYILPLKNLQKEDIKVHIDKYQNKIVFKLFIEDILDQLFEKQINDENTKISIEIYDKNFIIEAENYSDKDLNIYLNESINSKAIYDYKNTYGEVTWYKNITDEKIEINHNSRLYSIEITVMKDKKILTNLKGYKAFYNMGSV